MSVGHVHDDFDLDSSVFDRSIEKLDQVEMVDSFDVPYLGGISRDGRRVYKQRGMPSGYQARNGLWVDTDRYLKLHEVVEKVFLDRGLPYKLAHQVATQVEYAALKADGVDAGEYTDYMQGWIDEAEETVTFHVPDDLELRPYQDCEDHDALARMVPVSVHPEDE